jgi:hypothetical protein
VQALQPGLDKIHAALTSFEDWKTAAETLWACLFITNGTIS